MRHVTDVRARLAELAAGRTRRDLILVLLLGLAGSAHALLPQRSLHEYALRTWSKRDGLPVAWINAVLPSRGGYLWLATPDGLVRFDGVHFTVFNRGNSGLPSDGIRALRESADGRLWVATTRGLAVGDTQGGAFARVPALPAASFRSVDVDGDGTLWVMTSEAVWSRAQEGDRFVALAGLQPQAGELYRSLRGDPHGGIWLTTNRGLVRVATDGVLARFGQRDGLPSDDVLSVLIPGNGTVWVGTGHGVARRSRDGAFERVPAAGDRVVMALAQDHDLNVWAATRDGLLRLAGGSLELMGRAEGLPDEHASALAEDEEGNLWLGTEAGGLVRLRDGRAAVYGSAQGLGHDVVWSVTEGRDGSIWVATDGGGLNRLRAGRASLATSDPGLAREKVYALFEDRSGRLWFSTESHGLCSLAAGRTSCLKVPDDDLVRCFLEDKQGRLWAGTDGGLVRIEGGALHPVPAEDGKRLVVEVLAEGANEVIWVGTRSGLARLEGDVVRRVRLGTETHADEVDALLLEPDGTLWIGTVHAGLQRLRAGRLDIVSTAQGLPSDTVLSVLDDGLGRFWMSTGAGIVAARRADLDGLADGREGRLVPITITEADGLRDRECSGGVQPSAWRGRDGRLWYPTIAGVAVVDPRQVRASVRPSAAVIEGAVADGRTLALADGLELPAGTRHLEIRYTAPNFVAPERVRFEHALEGLDPAFFSAGAERVAHYTGLGPGHYRFRVRASNEDGRWSENATALALVVRPYFWQTSLFYVACVIGLLTGAWGLLQLRTRALRKRERELQLRVDEEMAQVEVLSGLLPICAWCKRVRHDAGYWEQIEAYVSQRSRAQFTHGICPDCAEDVHAGRYD